MRLRLYHYWRSSSSWRVRWALAIKGMAAEMVSVDLLSGESESPEHLARNPAGFVPVLEFLDGAKGYLTESMAIMEWLEETHPSPSLFPRDALMRGHARELAGVVYAGTQPLQNPNVAAKFSDDPAKQKAWNQHWIRNGLGVYEKLVQRTAGRYSVGDAVTIADLCLVPQCYNARRFEVSLDEFPAVARINEECLKLDSCKATAPDKYEPAKRS